MSLRENTKSIQTWAGAIPDGIWGLQSSETVRTKLGLSRLNDSSEGAMLLAEDNKVLQKWAKATVDGIWGPETAAALLAKTKAPLGVSDLSVKGMLELISHEAIVTEAYKDSKGVWTWGVGVTDKSGHRVGRYKDAPQTLEHVLRIFVWLVREKYLPDVLKAFEGYPLTDEQLAAAVSFHYNTGKIKQATWVKLYKEGNIDEARKQFMFWRIPEEIIPRREKECALFFDGKWSSNGKALVIPVRKPSYVPNFKQAKRVDIQADLEEAMRG